MTASHPVGQAATTLENAHHDDHDRRSPRGKDARKWCLIEERNPDDLILSGSGDFPRWHLYRADAKRIIAADPLIAEAARLEALVYAPGLKRCAKCSFVLLSQTLHMGNGAVTANDQPEQCPNGCGPLWRVTERENRIEMQDHAATLSEEKRVLTAEHAQLKADVVEVLTAARIDVDYKRNHSQNKIGMMNAVRTTNMIDALLDRLNGGENG